MQVKAYLIGLAIIFIAIYAQYFVNLGFAGNVLLVYGVPIAAIAVINGRQIIKKALNNSKKAVILGFGYFGILIVLGLFLSAIVLAVILAFNPNAISILNRPNPVLNVSPEFARLLILLSFLVLGPAEEFIFRGFIYGGLLEIFKNQRWLPLAIVSAILFTAAHLYYAEVYGVVSVVLFIIVAAFGIAMAITYFLSGGNLLVPSLIHGAFDASGFAGVAFSVGVGVELRGILIIAGIAAAFVLLAQRMLKKQAAAVPTAAPQPATMLQKQ